MPSGNGASKRLFLSPPHLSPLELQKVAEAFACNYIAPVGPQLDQFEHDFKDYTGHGYTVGLASGTAAMHLALKCLGVGSGDTVLGSTLTFIGSVSPVVHLGGKLVFIDSDASSWNMDPSLLADEVRHLLDQGIRPKAVIPTDLYGQSCDLDSIIEVCKPHGIPVICDSAEAVGARYKDRHAGVGADAAIYSFNGNKIITTSSGGMLGTHNPALADEMKFLSQQARDPFPHYEHSCIGYNYRLSNVLAAIGVGQLNVVDERVEAKRRIFEYYQTALGDLPGIEFMPEAAYGRCTRWLTVVTIDPAYFGADREQVRLALESENIESRPVWKPMHLQPVFKGTRIRGGKVSEALFEYGLCLPSGTAMTVEDLERVVSIVRQVHLDGRLTEVHAVGAEAAKMSASS